MTYQISKYIVIKAALIAEANNNSELSEKMMKVIVRATRNEISQKRYSPFVSISKREYEDIHKKLETLD